MGRYRGPVIRLHRREGVNLGLKGRRTTDEKYDKRSANRPDSTALPDRRFPTTVCSCAKSRK